MLNGYILKDRLAQIDTYSFLPKEITKILQTTNCITDHIYVNGAHNQYSYKYNIMQPSHAMAHKVFLTSIHPSQPDRFNTMRFQNKNKLVWTERH